MKISRNTVATVNFVVTDQDGKVVGRTDPKRPIEALIGHGALVIGLEQALDGREKGDSFTATLNPALAYGEIDETLIQTIDRRMFGDFPLEIGNVFEADTSRGRVGVVVKEIRDSEVVVDGNHPLAGKTLTFLVTVEDVRAATPEEIEHGHVHHGGHCPSEEGEHHCCCGHHHHEESEEGEHHCCCRHDHDGEHHCCRDQEHEGGEGDHHCCGHHHHEAGEEGDHHCCRHHNHDGEEGEHHCCHHHDK